MNTVEFELHGAVIYDGNNALGVVPEKCFKYPPIPGEQITIIGENGERCLGMVRNILINTLVDSRVAQIIIYMNTMKLPGE